MRVLSYMTDFEGGLRKALKLMYPNATAESCYFHFIQANIKKAKKLGLLKKFENWEDGKNFFRKLLALPLLPSPDIIQTLNWLIRIHAPFYPIFKTFITYFEDYWLNNIKPAGFSVYKLKNQTNNYTEAYHRRLKRFLVNIHQYGNSQ
ncbi:uncharacterized protein LOC141526670 [Cotesia typhae]|uniref:uncharacterized protein LOC141526670 n=1 Tax=Cotesia typhae TaxID=2053667 RepID=UPI003D693C26